MKNKKMIVVDLDGTLLNINSGCSRKAKKYLKRLKDLGYIIVIATGRILSDAINITDGAEFVNYIISDSGGLIYDMDNSKIIRKSDILKKDVICLSSLRIRAISIKHDYCLSLISANKGNYYIILYKV